MIMMKLSWTTKK